MVAAESVMRWRIESSLGVPEGSVIAAYVLVPLWLVVEWRCRARVPQIACWMSPPVLPFSMLSDLSIGVDRLYASDSQPLLWSCLYFAFHQRPTIAILLLC